MKKNILMIYPKIPATYWSFKHTLPFAKKKSLMPPLGLITVAALLPSDYQVKLIDLNIAPLKKKDLKNIDLIFLSAMIVQKKSFHEVINFIKEFKIPIVAGGPYPSSSFEKIDGVDFFILNEAEKTLPLFLKDYEKGCPQKSYASKEKPDITLLPPPRFDLLKINDYSSMSLQSSRGCPFNCEFCDIIEMFGRVPRYKKPEQFVNELNTLFKVGYKGPLFIVDDNFIGNKTAAKNLLQAILSWQQKNKFPFSFFTETSINLAKSDEILDLMVKAGFNMVFIGIETTDPETLKKTQKIQNVNLDLLESVKKIQKKGLEVLGGFILGFDDEPENIFELQIDFIQKAGIPLAMIGLMMVLPHTQLYKRLQKEGRLLGESHGNNTHEMDLNFIPTRPKDELIAGYKRVLQELYNPKKYFARSLTLLKTFPKKNFISRPITKGDLSTFFRSFFKQTFSAHGFQYLKFLLQALKYNRQNFHFAVNLAVKGYHFFKITEEICPSSEKMVSF